MRIEKDIILSLKDEQILVYHEEERNKDKMDRTTWLTFEYDNKRFKLIQSQYKKLSNKTEYHYEQDKCFVTNKEHIKLLKRLLIKQCLRRKEI